VYRGQLGQLDARSPRVPQSILTVCDKGKRVFQMTQGTQIGYKTLGPDRDPLTYSCSVRDARYAEEPHIDLRVLKEGEMFSKRTT
jgi:hypothetical protein